MKDLTPLLLYQGSEAPLPELIPLRAGPWSLFFENGDLRYLRLGKREAVRRLYAATRDRNWGTLPNRLSNVKIDRGDGSFRISYQVENRRDDIDFPWKGDITGGADGTIVFRMEGTARTTFLKNRLGFCILHPADCAGDKCRVVQADGNVVESAFPRLIAPRDPFLEIRSMSHDVEPGIWIDFELEGDLFEMEDQRNWLDASFKTFCTPLRLPFPAQVHAGQRIAQSITLKVRGRAPAPMPEQAGEEISIRLATDAPRPLPSLGLGMPSHADEPSPAELERLRALRPAHLRADLLLSSPTFPAALERAARAARALNAPLEAALFLSNDAEKELAELARRFDALRPPVARWLIFHTGEKSTTERWVDAARPVIERLDPRARVGSGTNAYFTELNRGRPPAKKLDVVCFSVNAQVHAFDLLSIAETLETYRPVLESARAFSEGRELAVTPITLKPRFNPDATAPAVPGPGELPQPVDVRQMSLFGAGWTLGSIAQLAGGGAASATFYETTGWRGVMETAAGSPAPGLFPSIPGSVFPLYHVLRAANEMSGGEALAFRSSAPLDAAALVLRKGGRLRFLVANLSGRARRLLVEHPIARASVHRLHERTARQAMQSPEEFLRLPGEDLQGAASGLRLELLPFETAWFDVPR